MSIDHGETTHRGPTQVEGIGGSHVAAMLAQMMLSQDHGLAVTHANEAGSSVVARAEGHGKGGGIGV